MASFRGIGDAATQVIQDQNRLGMQAAGLSEQARQFDVSVEERRKAREQQAAQFNVEQQSALGQRTEQKRQFDAAFGQRERALAEQQRQFNVGSSLDMAKENRQQTMDDFKMGIDSLVASADLETKDADKRLRLAQLQQYKVAADEEARQMKNREELATDVFVNLGLVAASNGGVVPAKAGQIAANEIGTKGEVRGVTDFDGSGDTVFDIPTPDGKVMQKVVSAPKMFLAIAQKYGLKQATAWANLFSHNQSVALGIQRAQLAAQAKAQSGQTAFYDKRADTLEARLAKMEANLPATPEGIASLKTLRKDAAEMRRLSNEAHGIGKLSPSTSETTETASLLKVGDLVPDELVTKLGLPSSARVDVDPKTGEKIATWIKGDRRVGRKLSFANAAETPSEKPSPAASVSSQESVSEQKQPVSERPPVRQSELLPEEREKFLKWAEGSKYVLSRDYDMVAAWKDGLKPNKNGYFSSKELEPYKLTDEYRTIEERRDDESRMKWGNDTLKTLLSDKATIDDVPKENLGDLFKVARETGKLDDLLEFITRDYRK